MKDQSKDRLKELRKVLNLKQREVAERLEVNVGLIGTWECGRQRIPKQRIKQICSEYHVRRQWLETGEGEMFEPEEQPKTKDEILREAAYALFAELSEPAQNAVMQVMADITMKAFQEKLNAPKPASEERQPGDEKTAPDEILVAMR